MTKIIPAILTDNLNTFRNQIKQMEGVADIVQIDISDGQFTPFKSLSADDARQVATSLKYELHLMNKDPSAVIEEWYNIPNISSAVFHIEAAKIPAAVIEHIKSYGWTAGVALNPETPIEAVEASAYQADKILFLSVTPGAQGQSFVPAILEKIKNFKTKHPAVPVAVDGGIHETELKQLKELRVEEVVVGSEIFAAPDPAKRFLELKALL